MKYIYELDIHQIAQQTQYFTLTILNNLSAKSDITGIPEEDLFNKIKNKNY